MRSRLLFIFSYVQLLLSTYCYLVCTKVWPVCTPYSLNVACAHTTTQGCRPKAIQRYGILPVRYCSMSLLNFSAEYNSVRKRIVILMGAIWAEEKSETIVNYDLLYEEAKETMPRYRNQGKQRIYQYIDIETIYHQIHKTAEMASIKLFAIDPSYRSHSLVFLSI